MGFNSGFKGLIKASDSTFQIKMAMRYNSLKNKAALIIPAWEDKIRIT
jgi:hypothetical protein